MNHIRPLQTRLAVSRLVSVSLAISLSLSVSLSLSLRASLAAAQPGPPAAAPAVEDADTAAARLAHVRGLEARENGDWAAVHAAFLEAWKHKRHWEIALNLGEAAIKVGKYKSAIDYLMFGLAEPAFSGRSPHLVEQEHKQVTAWIKEASAMLGTVRITIDLPGTRVLLDGEPLGNAPLTIDVRLDPGSHVIEAQKTGEKTVTKTVAVRSGATEQVRWSAPEARQKAKPEKPSPPSSSGWALGVGIGAGLASASAVGGGVLHGIAAARLEEVKESLKSLPGKPGDPRAARCAGDAAPVCEGNARKLREVDSLQVAGSVAFAAAGAIAVGTVVFAAVLSRQSGAGVAVAPSVGRGQAGVWITGQW